MVIVINSAIGEFSWVHLIWLTDVTSDYSQLSDYNPTQWLVNKNVVNNAPIKFEEIVIVMIKNVIFFFFYFVSNCWVVNKALGLGFITWISTCTKRFTCQ